MSVRNGLFIMMACLSWATARAQDMGTVSGTVSDRATRETLVGANVFMLENKGVGASTDIEGRYSLRLPVGTHRLICSFTGMGTDTATVTITAGTAVKHDYELSNIVEELGVVVVTAGKFEQKLEELTVSMDIIKPDLIQNKNSTNITSALNQVPGVVILDEAPQIRSGSGYSFGLGSRVAILVDDLPIMQGDLGKAEWSFIPIENVDQVEVIKGASSVLYGSSALSGVINVRSAYPKDQPQTKVNVYSGMYSAQLPDNVSTGRKFANAFGLDGGDAIGKKWWDGLNNYSGMNFLHSQKFGNLDMVIGGNFNYDHGFIGPHVPGSTDWYSPRMVDTSLADISNGAVREIRGRFNFNLRYRDKKVRGLAYGVNGNFMRSSKNFSLIWQFDNRARQLSYDTTGVGYDGMYRAYPGSMTLTEMFTFYVDPFMTYITEGGTEHIFRTRILYSDSDNSNNQSNGSIVIYGQYTISKSFQRLFGLNMTAGIQGNYTKGWSQIFVGGGSDGTNDAKNFSLFAQLDKKFWKVLNVSAGIRGEYFQINSTDFVVKPIGRAGVSMKMARETYVRASFGQGYRFPTIAEKYIRTTSGGFGVYPNKDLQPETSWNAEIGFKQGFKIGKFMGYADLVGFWQEFNNSIEFVMGQFNPAEGIPGIKFLNIGETRVRGIELSLMGFGQFTKSFGRTIMAGYTYTIPEAMNPTDTFHVNDPGAPYNLQYYSHYRTSIDSTNLLKYRFRHIANADIEFTYRKWSLGYSFRYYSYMENIDGILYQLDAADLFGTGVIEARGDERTQNTYRINPDNHNGNYVMDLRVSCQATKWMKVAVVMNNFLNRQYSLRPLKMESPRTTAIQITFKV